MCNFTEETKTAIKDWALELAKLKRKQLKKDVFDVFKSIIQGKNKVNKICDYQKVAEVLSIIL